MEDDKKNIKDFVGSVMNKYVIIDKKEHEREKRRERFKIALVATLIVISSFFITSYHLGSLATLSLNRFVVLILILVLFFLIFFMWQDTIIRIFYVLDPAEEVLEREKLIKERAENEKISVEEARRLFKEEDYQKEVKRKELEEQKKKKEIESDFLRTLYSLRDTERFYWKSAIIFSVFSVFCVWGIYLLAQNYQTIDFAGKSASMVIVEGIVTNFRFLMYESLVITLLAFFLKKISGYISMIEICKELDMLVVMDVQRQNRTATAEEKNIVSKEFQEKFSSMIEKHYDSFIKNKAEIKLKTVYEMANALKENKK